MHHLKKRRKFNRTTSHRKMLLRNLTTSLLQHEMISTTTAKAESVRSVVEKLITLAKQNNFNSKKQAKKIITTKISLYNLFSNITKRFINQNGGYTRIIKNGFRKGDNAPLSIIQIINNNITKPNA